MRTILVVGGSKGIGKALVDLLVPNTKVISMSRSPLDLSHENLEQHLCDVLSDNLPDLEALDALVYCPGSINLKPFGRLQADDFRDDFEINVMGAVRVMQKYAPVLKKGKHPSALLFSTVAVKMGMPFHASIAAAKGAVEGLVKSLAAEFAPHIRINAIAPTITDTTLASKILRNDRMKEMSAERHPMKKYLAAPEVAAMADFYISDKSTAVSGQIIPLDCGLVTLKI
jgi:NAD(P)-dependent dehydrogenase (short-subunit alcohol dehydrogenase family)